LEDLDGRARMKIVLKEFVTGEKLDSDVEEEGKSTAMLCNQAFQFLQTLMPTIRNFILAADLVETMRLLVFYTTQPSEALVRDLSDTAGKVLIRNWLNPKLKGSHISSCVRLFVRYAENPLDKIRHMVGNVLPLVLLENQEENIFLATLNKSTFPNYFVGIAAELTTLFTNAILPKASASSMEIRLHLKTLVKHSEGFMKLTELCKHFPKNKALLSQTLKQGRLFLETIIRRMTFYQKHYRGNKESIMAFFKNVQKCTRVLQIICTHGKKLKASTIMNHVPPAKKAMEKFIHCTKLFCQQNGMISMFWSGNLKQKNLDGSVLLSQHSQASDEETESEED